MKCTRHQRNWKTFILSHNAVSSDFWGSGVGLGGIGIEVEKENVILTRAVVKIVIENYMYMPLRAIVKKVIKKLLATMN